jgi:hypothetical protein
MLSLVQAFIDHHLNSLISHGVVEIWIRTVTSETEFFFRVEGRHVFEMEGADNFWDYIMHTLEVLGAGVAVGDEKSWNLIGRGTGWELLHSQMTPMIKRQQTDVSMHPCKILRGVPDTT